MSRREREHIRSDRQCTRIHADHFTGGYVYKRISGMTAANRVSDGSSEEANFISCSIVLLLYFDNVKCATLSTNRRVHPSSFRFISSQQQHYERFACTTPHGKTWVRYLLSRRKILLLSSYRHTATCHASLLERREAPQHKKKKKTQTISLTS